MKYDAEPRNPRFKWVTNGMNRGINDIFDVPVYADTAAVAVPSLGSFVAGWAGGGSMVLLSLGGRLLDKSVNFYLPHGTAEIMTA